MTKKITVNNKEYEMPKLSIDGYMDYLEIEERVDTHTRYTKKDIEDMCECICSIYGNQFTVKELKDPKTVIDPSGLIMEFQGIDMGIGKEIEKRIETIAKNS